MIKLTDTLYVSASDVKAIRKSDYHEYIIVETFGGASHSVVADYGQSIYRKLDELVEAVRADSAPTLPVYGPLGQCRTHGCLDPATAPNGMCGGHCYENI